nr:ATP-binding cassette domain-containing protein [Longitalea arenae]
MLNATGQIRTYAFTINDLVQENKTTKVPGSQTPPPIHTITLEQLNFTYGQQAILTDLSCQLQQGELVGIDGASGKGKTTLLNILLGFITPESGRLYINQQPVSHEQCKAYWPQIAYVKQQPFFMYDTLLANITLNGGQYHHQRLHQALEMAGLSEWLPFLPAGLHTQLTENAKNISGGQRQRIALARALYKEASVLILDEPFSELDEKAEEKLLHHLHQLAAAGKIIILITHNKKSLQACNKIIKL